MGKAKQKTLLDHSNGGKKIKKSKAKAKASVQINRSKSQFEFGVQTNEEEMVIEMMQKMFNQKQMSYVSHEKASDLKKVKMEHQEIDKNHPNDVSLAVTIGSQNIVSELDKQSTKCLQTLNQMIGYNLGIKKKRYFKKKVELSRQKQTTLDNFLLGKGDQIETNMNGSKGDIQNRVMMKLKKCTSVNHTNEDAEAMNYMIEEEQQQQQQG